MKWDGRSVIEAVGLLAVVLSLVFVGLQMRQDPILARAALGAEAVEAINDLELVATDSDFARTFAKMLNEPAQLTDGEKIQINAYLSSVKSIFLRECYLVQRGVYQECNLVVESMGPINFGSSYAQSWWKRNWRSTPYLPDWVNSEIVGLRNNSSRQVLLDFEEGI